MPVFPQYQPKKIQTAAVDRGWDYRFSAADSVATRRAAWPCQSGLTCTYFLNYPQILALSEARPICQKAGNGVAKDQKNI